MKRTKKENGMYRALIVGWQDFYQKLGIHCNFSKILIPDDPGGFSRIIIMAKGITPESAFQFCRQDFPCEKSKSGAQASHYVNSQNLNKWAVSISGREAKNGAYAIRIHDHVGKKWKLDKEEVKK